MAGEPAPRPRTIYVSDAVWHRLQRGYHELSVEREEPLTKSAYVELVLESGIGAVSRRSPAPATAPTGAAAPPADAPPAPPRPAQRRAGPARPAPQKAPPGPPERRPDSRTGVRDRLSSLLEMATPPVRPPALPGE